MHWESILLQTYAFGAAESRAQEPRSLRGRGLLAFAAWLEGPTEAKPGTPQLGLAFWGSPLPLLGP